jgi:hypothetical protein
MEGFITERMNRPFFVVRQYNGGDLEFGGSTQDEPDAQFRTRLLEKSGKFVPPFDRLEMFGLTFAIVHQILLKFPGIEKCKLYAKTCFKSLFWFIFKWPAIGPFEKEPEMQTIAHISSSRTNRLAIGCRRRSSISMHCSATSRRT